MHAARMNRMEQMLTKESLAHQAAVTQLQDAARDKAEMSKQIQELSQQLDTALNQIEELSTDLATTRSIMEAAKTQEKSTKEPIGEPSASQHQSHPELNLNQDFQSSFQGPLRSIDEADTEDSDEGIEDDKQPKWKSVVGGSRNPSKSCGNEEGCGTDVPPAKFDLSVKPRAPPVFSGKPNEDVEIWIQQVDNFLSLIGGPDRMQVAYVANVLQNAAQLWFQRECKAGNRPVDWEDLANMLLNRFGNTTKKEFAQSSLMNIRQGKNESAHEYAMRFEATLDKVEHYDEKWVKNIFVWGLQPNLATTVSLKSPPTLSRAIQLAKKVDSSVLISRRPGGGYAGNSEQKKSGGSSAAVSTDRKWKSQWKNQKNQWKKQSYDRGAQNAGQQQQRSNFQPQGAQQTYPPSRTVQFHPAGGRGGGPGPRRFGMGNQRRRQVAVVTLPENSGMAGQSGQESRQQLGRSDPTASRNQRSGN